MLHQLLTRKSTLTKKDMLANKIKVEATKNGLDKLLAAFSPDCDMKPEIGKSYNLAFRQHDSTNTIQPMNNLPVLMEFKAK